MAILMNTNNKVFLQEIIIISTLLIWPISMSHITRKPVWGFRPSLIQPVQPRKVARGLKFLIEEEEGLQYLCSENKGADQLHGYRAADLHHCLRIRKKTSFLMTWLFKYRL